MEAKRKQEEQLRNQSISQTRDVSRRGGGQVAGVDYFHTVVAKCDTMLKFNPRSRKRPQALLLMGKARYELRQYLLAEMVMRALLDQYKKHKLSDDAQYYLILIM
ncbi:MAG: hypothetical protein U9P14_07110, partial [Gemmatimonadota bacterium]|nr:hypothetical protein [Gemmatimonadota bacterium]